MSYFTEPQFQDRLVAHLIRNRTFLKFAGTVLDDADFQPTKDGEGWECWVTATLALRYWNKYRQPVDDLLQSEILYHVKMAALSEKQKTRLLTYAEGLKKKSLEGSDSLTDRVVAYKKERKKALAIRTLAEKQAAGQLPDEEMIKICRDALDVLTGEKFSVTDFLSSDDLERRISRRRQEKKRPIPTLYIEPLDTKIHMIARGQMGLWLGPWKRGKSLALVHTAMAYCLQGYNTLYLTLEDPREVVEDRFEAMTTAVPFSRLTSDADEVKAGFERYRRFIRGRLRVVDGTEQRCSVEWMEQLLHDQKERGFLTDALIIDYDDEIVPPVRYKDRRVEFAEIYRELRRLAGRWKLFLWTAAQTQRNTQSMKRITGDQVAEDISKIRKVTLALSIGNGTEDTGHKNALYLYVAAHKTDQADVGTYVIHKRKEGIFYDREATNQFLKIMHARWKKKRQQENP